MAGAAASERRKGDAAVPLSLPSTKITAPDGTVEISTMPGCVLTAFGGGSGFLMTIFETIMSPTKNATAIATTPHIFGSRRTAARTRSHWVRATAVPEAGAGVATGSTRSGLAGKGSECAGKGSE